MLAADMCIVRVRVRSVGVHVSIALGTLMFIWGNPTAEVSSFCYVVRPLTI